MRHLVETGLTLLTTASLPLQFWIYAFHTTTHPIKRLPTKVFQFQSPFQVLFNKIPNYMTISKCLIAYAIHNFARIITINFVIALVRVCF